MHEKQARPMLTVAPRDAIWLVTKVRLGWVGRVGRLEGDCVITRYMQLVCTCTYLYIPNTKLPNSYMFNSKSSLCRCTYILRTYYLRIFNQLPYVAVPVPGTSYQSSLRKLYGYSMYISRSVMYVLVLYCIH